MLVDQIVSTNLQRLGTPCHVAGFNYLQEAISMILYDHDNSYLRGGIMKRLYPAIAEKYKSTPTRVERGIRHALQLTWDRLVLKPNSEELFAEIMGPGEFPDNPLTNSEFFATMAEQIRLQLLDEAS